MTASLPSSPARETAVLGGGCFWCLEAVFDELAGVQSVESGYAGGRDPNPTYEDVCGGRTGHAEVVRIAFDPSCCRSATCSRCSSRSTTRRRATARATTSARSTVP